MRVIGVIKSFLQTIITWCDVISHGVTSYHVVKATHLLTLLPSQAACEVIEFALDTGMRLLYLLLCVLAVLRALVITFPYSNTLSRYRTITLRIIILSVLLLSGQSLVPVILRLNRDDLEPCRSTLKQAFTNQTVYRAWRICTVFLQVTLAMVVMLLANAVSVHRLLKSRTARNCAKRNARNSAAITTVVLTMSFFLLHISGVVYMSCVTAGAEIEMNHFIANGISLLSPVVDPAVYFLRLANPCCQTVKQTLSSGSRHSRTQITDLVSRGSYRMSGFKLLPGSRKASLCRSLSRSPPKSIGSGGQLNNIQEREYIQEKAYIQEKECKERLVRTVECQVEEKIVENGDCGEHVTAV